MSTLSFTELLPEFGKLTPVIAERWVAATLADAAVLREYDGRLYPADPALQPAADRLHEAWRRWVENAQVALREADSLAASGTEIPNIGALRDAVGRTRSMLRMTPGLIIQRHGQVQRGEVFSIEEVRRELRTGSRR